MATHLVWPKRRVRRDTSSGLRPFGITSCEMPRRLRLVLPAVRTKSPLPQRVPSVCVACGGRNLVRFAARSQQVQCRSCGLVSPDFNQPRAPSGYTHDGHADAIDANQARVMLDEMLDALSHDNAKRTLQALQKQARSDVPLLCHFYVPFVVDVCAVVAARYGFSASMEGVKESLRVLQRHATSEEDGQLSLQLIRLRRVLTPTGTWIQEDAEAEADELKKRADDRERQRRQQEETARMEELAAENARKARLHAKKIALGLDPSVPRPPQLDAEPPRALVVHAESRVELRVVARLAMAFQWFFQGKPLLPRAGDDELYTGAQRSTLTVRRLTQRFVGDYYCVCTNEEGAVSSSTTRVQMLTELESQRVATRKLKTIPSGHGAVPMELGRAGSLPLSSSSTGGGAPSQPTSPPSLVALCVAGALLLLHAKTLAPAKTVPPIALPAGALAAAVTWLPTAKILAVLTSTDAKAAKSYELLLFVIDTPSMSTNASPSSPAVSSSHTSSSSSSSPAKLVKQSSKTNANAPPPPQVFLSRPLATYKIPATLRSVAFARFLDGGRTLLVSDLHAAIFVFELTPTALLCKRVVRYDDDPLRPLCHIALTSSTPPGLTPSAGAFASGFAVCRRNSSAVELLENGREGSKALRFQAPVHRVAFDCDGFTLAVAESGSIKTWVSIVSLTSREPSRAKRFVAHVGKISGMQWTAASSLLCTSGYDGYVKLWDLEHTPVPCASGGRAEPTCMFRVHLDARGVHSLALLEESDPVAWVAVGFSDCRLHTRALPQLRALEATRSAERDWRASQIQKIVKGRVTRNLINKFIRSGESK